MKPMNINYVFLKNALLGLLFVLSAYQIAVLTMSVLSRPQNIELNFQPINQSIMQSSVESVSPSLVIESSEFDYKIVGYRAGGLRSSVIVERQNQSFVVQQGALLENKYKLISVGSDSAIFEYMGKQYQLSTNLINEK